jgi:ACR3 family arsenite transporter
LGPARSFTATKSNLELSSAVAAKTLGIASREALATVIGQLIEVPVLLGLVHVVFWTG